MDVKGDAQTVGQTLPDKAATHMLSSTSASTLIANRNGLLLVLRNLTVSYRTIFPSTYAVRMNAMGSGLLKKIVMTEGGGSSGVASQSASVCWRRWRTLMVQAWRRYEHNGLTFFSARKILISNVLG
jgi:hypothetical protein